MTTPVQLAALTGRKTRVQEAKEAWDELDGKVTLHPTSQKVLDYIREYIKEWGFSPSNREIARGCGLATGTVARHHIQRLIELKKIRPLYDAKGRLRALVVR